MLDKCVLNIYSGCGFVHFARIASFCPSTEHASNCNTRTWVQLLTPAEFVTAGDHLVSTVGSWSWYAFRSTRALLRCPFGARKARATGWSPAPSRQPLSVNKLLHFGCSHSSGVAARCHRVENRLKCAQEGWHLPAGHCGLVTSPSRPPRAPAGPEEKRANACGICQLTSSSSSPATVRTPALIFEAAVSAPPLNAMNLHETNHGDSIPDTAVMNAWACLQCRAASGPAR